MSPFVVLTQSAAPFFSNDQFGVLRVIVIVVLPIIFGVGAWVWRLSHTQEKQDINKIGEKVDGGDKRMGAIEVRMASIEGRMGEDRLAAQAALFESQRGMLEQLNLIRNSVVRVEERVCNANDMRDAVIDGMRAAMKEYVKERDK
jgi:hypothetical protein